ncbi:unnamed protein product [Prorocentrum cordatum]|uniref:RNase H type-1 domain-containing protein n=1 Tax=Prorocentrum cordatum TaxID=2364126 RepID=A0ABN9U006_9DINO|nr:unnamed protein product [Polarella glacialis]
MTRKEPKGPLVKITSANAQELANLAQAAGDPAGAQRYLELAAAGKAAEPQAPAARQRWQKAEQEHADITRKLQSEMDKLDRWRKSQANLISTIADVQLKMDAAEHEVKTALAEIQSEHAEREASQRQSQPTISIRKLVEGEVQLDNILSMDVFLGTEAVFADYDLDPGDKDELEQRKTDVAKQIQAGLAQMFTGALDKAKEAIEAQRKHVSRLEGKRRRTGTGGRRPCCRCLAKGSVKNQCGKLRYSEQAPGPKTWKLATVKVTSAQAEGQEISAVGPMLARWDFDGMAIQEHKILPGKTDDVVSRLRHEGWHAALPPAEPGKTVHSAFSGVGVAMRSDIAMARPPALGETSVRLSLRDSWRNCARAWCLAELIKLGELRTFPATIVAPDRWTCTAGKGRTTDHSLVSDSERGMVRLIYRLDGLPIATHRGDLTWACALWATNAEKELVDRFQLPASQTKQQQGRGDLDAPRMKLVAATRKTPNQAAEGSQLSRWWQKTGAARIDLSMAVAKAINIQSKFIQDRLNTIRKLRKVKYADAKWQTWTTRATAEWCLSEDWMKDMSWVAVKEANAMWSQGGKGHACFCDCAFDFGDEEAPPVATPAMIQTAAKTFSPKTASGIDRWGPRSFLMFSDASLDAFAHVMDQAERIWRLPQHLRNTILPQLPKPDGGHRLIGLKPDALRVYNGAHKYQQDRWNQQHKRDYEYARAGKSTEQAVWEHALLTEDGYLLQCYGGRRSVKFGAMMSTFIYTNRGVIAGCSFAVSVIKCFTLDVYDRLYYLWPSLDISLVVDDSTLQSSGAGKQVVQVISEATKEACRLFEGIAMIVSVDQGQVARQSSGNEHIGRSRIIQFMLSNDTKSDPTYDANALPLVTWLIAMWKGWATLDQMKLAFRFGSSTSGKWGAVIGPAGAVLATLRRLGWTAQAWDKRAIPQMTIATDDARVGPLHGPGITINLQEMGGFEVFRSWSLLPNWLMSLGGKAIIAELASSGRGSRAASGPRSSSTSTAPPSPRCALHAGRKRERHRTASTAAFSMRLNGKTGAVMSVACWFTAGGNSGRGWAVVVVDSRGNMLGALYGPVRFPWACSGSGELWAAIFALKFKGPEPIVIVTDCLELRKAWERRDNWDSTTDNHLGELWRKVWRLVDEIGVDDITVE